MKKIISVLMLMAGMMCSAQSTPNIGLQIPPNGSTNWNLPLNYNFNALDNYLGGVTPFPNMLQGPGFNATTGFQINGSYGSNGQYLTSTGSGSQWSNSNPSGSITAAGQYSLPIYSATGTGNNLGGSNITVTANLNNLVVPGLVRAANGFDMAGATVYQEVTNDTSVGSTLYSLICLVSVGGTLVSQTCATNAPIWTGVAIGGATGTAAGSTQIAIIGRVTLLMDGASTVGDYVQQSPTIAGYGTDGGATFPLANSGSVVGIISAGTSTSGQTATVILYVAGGSTGGGGSGPGTIGEFAFYPSNGNTVGGNSHLVDSGGNLNINEPTVYTNSSGKAFALAGQFGTPPTPSSSVDTMWTDANGWMFNDLNKNSVKVAQGMFGTPTIAPVSAGAGSLGTAVCKSLRVCTDKTGVVTVTTSSSGTAPAASSEVFTITFGNTSYPYPNQPNCPLSGADATTRALTGQASVGFSDGSSSTTGAVYSIGTTALPATATTYTWTYTCDFPY